MIESTSELAARRAKADGPRPREGEPMEPNPKRTRSYNEGYGDGYRAKDRQEGKHNHYYRGYRDNSGCTSSFAPSAI